MKPQRKPAEKVLSAIILKKKGNIIGEEGSNSSYNSLLV